MKRRWLVIAGSLVALTAIAVAAGAWTYQNTVAHRVKIVWVKPTYALASHHRSAKPKPLHAFGHPRQLTYPVLQYGSENAAVLRLQQLLAHHGYLPVSFKAKGEQPLSPIAPRNGSFHWAFTPPPGLAAQWKDGYFGTVTRGAVMSFESDNGMNPDGVAGAAVWHKLLAKKTPQSPRPYTYVYVSESLPESITIYHNASTVFQTSANTGIAQAPTALGTYPVYLRYTSTTMQGTNPDGSHYNDPNIPWVSYFNGGDAVHGFIRPSYGSPQSLGCVELPFSEAAQAYQLMTYGTLVTVAA
jgi:peptidoglycan hydrolase-like protein with peptidoglycan-binding domain